MFKLTPFRIILIYIVLSVIWITTSDLLVEAIAASTRMYTILSIIKGWLFILVTASIMYGLMKQYAIGRDRADQALQDSEERWKFALEGAGDGLWDWNVQTNEVFYSHQWKAMLGYGDDEIGNTLDEWDKRVHPGDKEYVYREIQRHFSGEAPVYMSEHRMLCRDGTYKWVLDRGKIVTRTADGKALRVIGTHTDITERRRAGEALQESQERFKELADSLPQSVFECDLQGNFTYFNKTGLKAFGCTESDISAGMNILQVVAPQDRQLAREAMERRLEGQQFGYTEFHALRRDGSTFFVGVHTAPIRRGDRTVGLRGLAIDMSDHKLVEAEMLKVEKLESLGILAGGIAHDFNNILTAILGNIALARMRLKPGSFEHDRLNDAEKASNHARDLTMQLLTFSKGGEPVTKTVAIDQVIRDAVGFALRGARVRSSLHFDVGLWPVEADAGQMSQVFQNLVLNACQAMPEGGVITIEACNAREEMLNVLPARGRYVHVTVRDEGTGIPEEYLAKIFDPFFTTKQTGSGLGLAVTYSIIRNHGGQITVSSRIGQGTTFTVLLPASESPAAEIQAASAVSFRGKGSILIMDDEEMVRNVAGGMVREFGFEVVFARDGLEAVRLYKDAADAGKPFVAVIMDLTIPGGMGGKEAVQELLHIDPHVRAIASSGYSNDPVMANHREYGFSAVIAKPYKPEDLGLLLRDLLKA